MDQEQQNQLVESCKSNMGKRIDALEKELARVRTGRASVTLFDGVRVPYYGNPTPLSQVATLSTPDARTVMISPFEKTIIGDIEKAILKADLGLTPNADANVIRVPIPPLTEERRKDIVKSIKKMGEDAKVSIRQARRDANDKVKKSEKAKDLAEDASKKLQGDVQKTTDGFVSKVDEKIKAKEQEILQI